VRRGVKVRTGARDTVRAWKRAAEKSVLFVVPACGARSVEGFVPANALSPPMTAASPRNPAAIRAAVVRLGIELLLEMNRREILLPGTSRTLHPSHNLTPKYRLTQGYDGK